MPSLTASHERALTLLFSELASAAARRAEVFLGSPGSLAVRYAARAIRVLQRHLPSSNESAWDELKSLRVS